MTNYCILDAEMGGRELKYSLLQVYFDVIDENFNHIDHLYLNVKPDDGTYLVSGQGMTVNRINLANHDKIAMPYKSAKSLVYNFLETNGRKSRLVPVGHGVRGDITHVQQCLISEGSWNQFCTYHYMDTSVILQFLRACGKMPLDIEGSVGSLAAHFGYKPDAEHPLHDARTDACMTRMILKHFIEIGKK